MVYIHGGAFIIGSNSESGYKDVTERVVSRGVVVVAINYRLGPFGFFSTGDSIAPGNYGLWDQVQALKFVNQIIGAFNGNPKAVTIFGVSAGGASTSWLTLAPAAKDYFQRAIPMSGSASGAWASNDEVLLDTSSNLVKAAQCSGTENVKECLKKKSTAEIIAATSSYMSLYFKSDTVNFGYFFPRFDNDLVKASHMESAIKKAPKKPNLMGICSQEYITFGRPIFLQAEVDLCSDKILIIGPKDMRLGSY